MKLKITVHGVAYEVDVEVLEPGDGFPQMPAPRSARPKAQGGAAAPAPAAASRPRVTTGDGGGVDSPIAGTVIEIKCKAGDTVAENQVLMIIEAMKMKTSIAAPAAGKIKSVPVAAGDTVRESQILVEFE